MIPPSAVCRLNGVGFDGTFYARTRGMAQNSRSKLAGLVALVIALIIGATAAVDAHRRSTEKARLLADIHRLQLPASGYAMESTGSNHTPEETAWRSYCEQARVALIADARAAAPH